VTAAGAQGGTGERLHDRVMLDVADHVATVTLDRPAKHNALDVDMFEGILAAAESIAGAPGVRAVVVQGAGPSFCSGLDIVSIMAADPAHAESAGPMAGLVDRARGPVPNWFQRASQAWFGLPMPVIAALHGNVLGGGLQIALGADVRIAAADARLSVMEVKWGLIPDMGITRTLPRLVSIDVAKELTFTGRVVSGTEAATLGLVTRVADHPLLAAQELAAEIASRSPDAVRRAKRLYETSWTGSATDTLALEAQLQRELLGSANQLAAVTAGVSHEPPRFSDPR
jgi:enoyl-CoA hydratase/carnithine racemase